MEENIPFYSRLNGGINQSDKKKGKGFTARASSGKGNLKANNRMSILNSSWGVTALGMGWMWLGLAGSMSRDRREKALLELRRVALLSESLSLMGFTVSISSLLFSNSVQGLLQSSK